MTDKLFHQSCKASQIHTQTTSKKHLFRSWLCGLLVEMRSRPEKMLSLYMHSRLRRNRCANVQAWRLTKTSLRRWSPESSNSYADKKWCWTEIWRNSTVFKPKRWSKPSSATASDFRLILCFNWVRRNSNIGGHNLWPSIPLLRWDLGSGHTPLPDNGFSHWRPDFVVHYIALKRYISVLMNNEHTLCARFFPTTYICPHHLCVRENLNRH